MVIGMATKKSRTLIAISSRNRPLPKGADDSWFWPEYFDEPVLQEGGPGSGFHGHVGRPGKIGGSATSGLAARIEQVKARKAEKVAGVSFPSGIAYSVVGNPGESKLEDVADIVSGIPEPLRKLLKKVEIHEEDGPPFTAGGKQFVTGGSWEESTGTVRLYAVGTQGKDQLENTMYHEVGHAFQEEWYRKSKPDYTSPPFNDRMPGSPQKYKWFTAEGDLRVSPNELPKEMYLYGAYVQFFKAWDKGEDGITPYSKAWAKDGVFCETIAEMSKIYFAQRTLYKKYSGGSTYVRTPVKQLKLWTSGVDNLVEAFLTALGEIGGKELIEKAAEPLKGKTFIKFFNDAGVEVSPKEATRVVKLRITKDGVPIKSVTGFAKRLAEIGVKGKSILLLEKDSCALISREITEALDVSSRRHQLKTKLQKALFQRYSYSKAEEKSLDEFLFNLREMAFAAETQNLLSLSGCPTRRVVLTNSQIRGILRGESASDAASITNTHNYELIGAILKVAEVNEKPTRQNYADALQVWEERRADYKGLQIQQWTENRARALASQEFFNRNTLRGIAELQGPKPAKCPICNGWFNRGKVPAQEAVAHPPPYHLTCPHTWKFNMSTQVQSSECPLLWAGE